MKEGKMIEVERAAVQAEHSYIEFVQDSVDIDRVCRERSEETKPSEVFLLSSKPIGNSLLAVRATFLEDGQQLPCPGLPFVGAAFDPDWGFARAELKQHRDGSAAFQVPIGHPDTFTSGDTWGYRLCPIANDEIPKAICELANIRGKLANQRRATNRPLGTKLTVTEL